MNEEAMVHLREFTKLMEQLEEPAWVKRARETVARLGITDPKQVKFIYRHELMHEVLRHAV